MSSVDIALDKTKGYYDISFTNGDFTLTDGFDTALLMSIFCERRADASEVGSPELRRGWWGNLLNNNQGFEIGSKLWLLYQQRNTVDVLNNAINYVQECLQWFIDDNYLDNVNVTGSKTDESLIINIDLIINQSVVYSKSFDLWQLTGKI